MNEKLERGDTYVFDVPEETIIKELVPKLRTKVWQIFPSVCASLTCVPFGMMLGWPSPIYPKLLDSDTPIAITMDQSAMITGFLMLGVSFGTLFSAKHLGSGPKYGIVMSDVLILFGWIVMWHADNIYALLGSRFLVGTGHGYATGQIKSYITEMTEDDLGKTLKNHLNFYAFFGLVLAYAVGPFVSFSQLSLVSLIVTIFMLFLGIILPCTPRELIRTKKVGDALQLLSFLKPGGGNSEREFCEVVEKMSEAPQSLGFTKIMRDPSLRINFIKLSILLVCQQYSGLPPTLAYTQIIFAKLEVPREELFALLYAILFFVSSFTGMFVCARYCKKTVLLSSSCSVLFVLISNITVLYFSEGETYFKYCSVILIYLYVIFHAFGLGSVTFTLINDWFSPSYRLFVTKYSIIMFSLLALTGTKIFQVLLVLYPLYISFCFFAIMSFIAVCCSGVFLSYSIKKVIQ